MSKLRSAVVQAAIVVFWYSLTSVPTVWGQAPTKTAELNFSSSPSRQLFSSGEDIVATLEFWSRSEQPLYVSRLQNGAFVRFKATGPDGHEVTWQGVRADEKQYPPSDFTVLKQYTGLKSKRVISLKNGEGFLFDQPGQYSVTAEFSMDPSGRFDAAAAVGQAKPPTGAFLSEMSFCIEACISEPLPVSNNVPRSSLQTVRTFYNIITRYRQPGIPDGREMKAIRPLLSKRLAELLEILRSCDADYYRRFGDSLRKDTLKPSTPWLERGLFTGGDEASTPQFFRTGKRRAIGDHRVDVELIYTTPEINCHGESSCYEHFRGVVSTILENNRWVIDDYIAMYANENLKRLSAGYPQCKDNHWVDEGP